MSKHGGKEASAELNGGSHSVERLLGFIRFCLQTLWLAIVTPIAAVLWILQLLWDHLPELCDQFADVYAAWKKTARKEWRKFYSPNVKLTDGYQKGDSK